MSEADTDREEQLARIDRMLAERYKLVRESAKLDYEAFKLQHEGMKYQRDRLLAPFALAVGAMGAGAALFAAAVTFAKYLVK